MKRLGDAQGNPTAVFLFVCCGFRKSLMRFNGETMQCVNRFDSDVVSLFISGLKGLDIGKFRDCSAKDSFAINRNMPYGDRVGMGVKVIHRVNHLELKSNTPCLLRGRGSACQCKAAGVWD